MEGFLRTASRSESGLHFHEKIAGAAAGVPEASASGDHAHCRWHADRARGRQSLFSTDSVASSVCPRRCSPCWRRPRCRRSGSFDGVATIGSAFGGIPRELPGVRLAVAVAGRLPATGRTGLRHRLVRRDRVAAHRGGGRRHDRHAPRFQPGARSARALANILSPLFGGFAATGAIARTATNIRNGATSPVAGVVHAVFLVLVILLFAPLGGAHSAGGARRHPVLRGLEHGATRPMSRGCCARAPRRRPAAAVVTLRADRVRRPGGRGERRRGAGGAAVHAAHGGTVGAAVEQQPIPRRERTRKSSCRTTCWCTASTDRSSSARPRSSNARSSACSFGVETVVLRLGRVPFMDATGLQHAE